MCKIPRCTGPMLAFLFVCLLSKPKTELRKGILISQLLFILFCFSLFFSSLIPLKKLVKCLKSSVHLISNKPINVYTPSQVEGVSRCFLSKA